MPNVCHSLTNIEKIIFIKIRPCLWLNNESTWGLQHYWFR